jgi:hypothetical protein
MNLQRERGDDITNIYYDDKFIQAACVSVVDGLWYHRPRRRFHPTKGMFLHGTIASYLEEDGSICLPEIIEIHKRSAISDNEVMFLQIVDVFTDTKIIWE